MRNCGIILAAAFLFTAAAQAQETPSTLRPWGDYKVILWISDSAYKKPDRLPAFWQSAKAMGVNTGMVHHEGHESDQGKGGPACPFVLKTSSTRVSV